MCIRKEAKVSGLTKDEFLLQVQTNLNRYLERNRSVNTVSIAQATGYSRHAIQKFSNGTMLTLPVSAALIAFIPELGAGLYCPTCGHSFLCINR